MSDAKQTAEYLLSLADIKINGSRPFDIQVHDERFYKRVLANRELGLGESYMEGWWDVDRLDQFIARLLEANLQEKVKVGPAMVKNVAVSLVLNRQSSSRSKHNASHHYDIGNDLYERMLDKHMVYTCAYWKDAKTLDEAQEAKLDLVCRKLYLKKGMTVVDLGCGWGGFAEYAARKYGVIVTAATPAAEQVRVARERTKGLPVTIEQKDYREVTGTYDRVVSIGILEHIGPKNYAGFFRQCKAMLHDDGLMLHHTIGNNSSMIVADPWTNKYIFPGGVIPSLTQISRAIEKQLIVEDVHNFGPYYDKTLMAWHHNFIKHYPEIQDKYDERFYRMWNFYLLWCAGAFRARHLQLWQIVMRKIETSDVYEAVR
jgi:cyclopropane-fatty-acyl-phospholipid synthase